MSSDDHAWMQRALELAERGRGAVEPNPLVGAVLVREGHKVGEGYHQRFGAAHAEINALSQAQDAARGATLYLTLEPCCHHGKTPPCTEALIRAGIARVVAALQDPFPEVSGRGADQLRAAGIPVDFGLGAAEARRQNAPYLKLLATGMPYVHAKWAMSLDGKICTRTGKSQWISSEASRRRAHEIRGRMDAVVVGIGTALADDPLLTARPPGPRTPLRVVLDSQARLPLGSRLASTAGEAPVLVVTSPQAPAARLQDLRDRGCEVRVFPTGLQGRIEVNSLLAELGRRRCTNVLIEGGAEVLGSFRDAAAIDEVHVFIAPILFGGVQAKSPVAGLGVDNLAEALSLSGSVIETFAGDLYFHGTRR